MVSRPISIRYQLMPIDFAGIDAANLFSLFQEAFQAERARAFKRRCTTTALLIITGDACMSVY